MSAVLDAVVIGAGPAGVAAAVRLHRRGLHVHVVERARFPRFVIGESLLPRCMDQLEALGLMEAAAARGYLTKYGAAFFRGDERVEIDFREQFTDGWGYTWQVPRDDFDLTLAQAAQAQGVRVEFERTVCAFEPGPEPVLTLEDGEELRCRFVVDASGYGRVLPRLLGLNQPSDAPPRSALVAHMRGDLRESGDAEGLVWLANTADAWTWAIPFADGRVSVGVIAPAGTFDGGADLAETLRRYLASVPAMRARFASAELVLGPRLLTQYSIGVKQLYGDGWCLVGNATEFLDPVFSSGVMLALETGVRAADLVARQLTGEPVDWAGDYVDYVRRGLDVFRTFVQAWYDGRLQTVLFAPRKEPGLTRQITSVLAGYVWDDENPFVYDHARRVDRMARALARLS